MRIMYYVHTMNIKISVFNLLVLLLFATNCFADEFRIPLRCHPKELQNHFAETGRKLDLSGNDETRDSWGFIENKGSSFVIYTYRAATDEDMALILKVIIGG